VASSGREEVGDHAKVEVLCISLSFMVNRDEIVTQTWNVFPNLYTEAGPEFTLNIDCMLLEVHRSQPCVLNQILPSQSHSICPGTGI
jgi:hypothetical protein